MVYLVNFQLFSCHHTNIPIFITLVYTCCTICNLILLKKMFFFKKFIIPCWGLDWSKVFSEAPCVEKEHNSSSKTRNRLGTASNGLGPEPWECRGFGYWKPFFPPCWAKVAYPRAPMCFIYSILEIPCVPYATFPDFLHSDFIPLYDSSC